MSEIPEDRVHDALDDRGGAVRECDDCGELYCPDADEGWDGYCDACAAAMDKEEYETKCACFDDADEQ